MTLSEYSSNSPLNSSSNPSSSLTSSSPSWNVFKDFAFVKRSNDVVGKRVDLPEMTLDGANGRTPGAPGTHFSKDRSKERGTQC